MIMSDSHILLYDSVPQMILFGSLELGYKDISCNLVKKTSVPLRYQEIKFI